MTHTPDTPRYLVTHSGGFHADEVMSTVILTRLFPEAEVIRSRAADWITPGPDRVIYDVGGAYDAAEGVFDHHQRGAPLRADGQPFSSFGLIWQHFGMAYLAAMSIPESHRPAIHAAFDRNFVLPVDLVDNGVVNPSVAGPFAGLTLPGLIETLKPVFDAQSTVAEHDGFTVAVGIARAFVEAEIANRAAKLRAESIVQHAISAAGTGRVLELPSGMPFRSAVVKAGADHLLFVVHPRQKDWCVTGIRRSEDDFALRADLPLAWAGLTGAALETASGVPGALFCHTGRFIATAETREAALMMAGIAVRAAEAAQSAAVPV